MENQLAVPGYGGRYPTEMRERTLNPYDGSNVSSEVTVEVACYRSRIAGFLAVLACIAVFSLSALDQHREGCSPSVPLALFASSPLFPALVILFVARRSRHAVWWSCAFVSGLISLYGIVGHSSFAVSPTPRVYIDNVGQMHVLMFPILHWVVALVAYAVLGLLVLVLYSLKYSTSDG
ncbi:hypothetical protein Poly51_63210 [Rubripirellula tenax]|uniref:Transmembrane protein n=1 Tax=Rubripirellula tenax TaxID=2528015 RepID=A0A5C6E8M9_9BACT|nr:hypothetical protein Poly51_63210 [Rubripirellula tenax]